MATVYTKKGNKNWKEKKYIKKLNEYIEAETAKDPNFQFKPCDTFEELQSAFDTHCVEDVEFSETKNNTTSTSTEQSQSNGNSDNTADEQSAEGATEQTASTQTPGRMTAPFSQQEPMVRDYVLTDGLTGERGPIHNSGKTTFEEPVSFGESFVLPNETVNNNGAGQNQNSSKNPQTQQSSNQNTQSNHPQQDSENSAKERRKTKRLAKSIVRIVCKLAEKGFVWYANREITEEKLLEYELTGEIDLTPVVTLGEHEVPVRQWFQFQRLKAEELAKYTPEQISDLADALGDFLEEKGVKASPAVQLLVDTGEVLIDKALSLMELKAGTADILQQLRDMTPGSASKQQQQEQSSTAKREYKEPEHEILKQEEAAAAQTSTENVTAESSIANTALSEDAAEQALIEGKTIETKE